MKSKTQLQLQLKKYPKGRVKVKGKKVGRWIRYYLYNVKLNKYDKAYYTAGQMESMIKRGQIKSII